MKKGHLSQYFTAVVAKRLSAVEANPEKSNQHEFNGTKELKKIFGTGSGEPQQFSAHFVWIGKENEALSSEGLVTWYDARRDHPTRTEYRLYFPTTDVSAVAEEGDLMIIAQRTDGSLMIIIVASESTIENQLLWLFELDMGQGMLFALQEIQDDSDREIDFIVRFILEILGIEVEEPEAAWLDDLLQGFHVFPKTNEFSIFARQILKNVSPMEEPDDTLMQWLDLEEKLFRRLERRIVAKRLQTGFVSEDETDVDGFISFSLSVQNRRKSRAGYALENHLEEIFRVHKVRYSRVVETENRSRPDFLFPGAGQYHDKNFSPKFLTMLGVKTTCKDRWRQILSEAERIETKHLFTLEPGISTFQTDDMIRHSIQLVVPEPIRFTYTPKQNNWLMNLDNFLILVKDRQARS
jgi:hypothetical protein